MPAPWYDDGTQAGPGANSEGAPGASQGSRLNNAAAGTGAAFQLTGGLYAVESIATGAGTITLQRLAPDSATWSTALTAIAVATYTLTTVQLPPGQYRWLTVGFTAIYATVQRVPQA